MLRMVRENLSQPFSKSPAGTLTGTSMCQAHRVGASVAVGEEIFSIPVPGDFL
jgi:hypothetical protein